MDNNPEMIRYFCQDCGNDFLSDPNLDVPIEDQVCCMCWYSLLIYYEADESVFWALVDEVKELMEGMESDFERMNSMVAAAEEECDSNENRCDKLCGWYDFCLYTQDVYKLPNKEVVL